MDFLTIFPNPEEVPQYLILPVIAWLSITAIQQGKLISSFKTALNLHLENNEKDLKRLLKLEEANQNIIKDLITLKVLNKV